MAITAGRLGSISPTWGDWSPVWTTSTGANTPSFGNAVISARFAQSALTVYWKLDIVFGNLTSFGGGSGSDNWRISAPVPAAAISGIVGQGEGHDVSVANTAGPLGLRVRLTTATTFEFEVSTGRVDATAVTAGGIIDAVSPWTWASSDALRAWGQYEAAS
ncbi:hypothetical protein ACIOTI_08870 [Streptomyces sp. NPDC087843]|uniref:hypothetical protein n=1 Tax=Streptomyces sp. NPDC087843 TaxID=3365804 RepID=UPI003829925C